MNRIAQRQLSLSHAALGAAVIVAMAAACAQAAGNGSPDYAVTWFSSDSGSGTAAGGSYTLRGTLGQADADPLHPADADGFVLVSGYWAVPPTPLVDNVFADGFEAQ